MLFSGTPQIDPRLMPSSPTSSASSRSSTESYTFPRVSSDFQVEHLPTSGHTSPASKARRRRASSGHDGEAAYRASVARLMTAKTRPFSVTGRIPIDPSQLTLFFRSKVRPLPSSYVPISLTVLSRAVSPIVWIFLSISTTICHHLWTF